MELPAAAGLAAVAALVLANGFFVATEFAIVAVRRTRLEQLASEGSPSAAAARHVVEHLDRYIAACQFGITVASLGLGWIGEPALSHLIEPPMEALAGRFAYAAADGVAVGVAFALITTLHIVIGELAPKGLALQRTEATSLFVAQPMRVFATVFRWPVAVLNGLGNGVLRMFGLEPASGHEMVHSVEELRLLVTSSREAGVVEASEARIASRAFTFADRTAGALMTPRTEIDAVPLDLGWHSLVQRLAASAHSRLPVYDGSIDQIRGVVHAREALRALATLEAPIQAGQTGQPGPAPVNARALVRPVLTVPESKRADVLLEEMRVTRRQLAVVVDEYGGTAGIVTLEDLMEALVGPIEDELAAAGDPDTALLAVETADGSRVIDGLTRLGDWHELTGESLNEADCEDVETVGGLVMTRLGRIPVEGDEVQVGGVRLRVEALDGKRVALVRLLPPDAPPAPQVEEEAAA